MLFKLQAQLLTNTHAPCGAVPVCLSRSVHDTCSNGLYCCVCCSWVTPACFLGVSLYRYCLMCRMGVKRGTLPDKRHWQAKLYSLSMVDKGLGPAGLLHLEYYAVSGKRMVGCVLVCCLRLHHCAMAFCSTIHSRPTTGTPGQGHL